MIEENDRRIIKMMIDKIDKMTDLVSNYQNEIINNYVYSDSLQYEFEKLYEDSKKLSVRLLIVYPDLPIDQLRAIRNRVAHDYETVIIDKLINTVQNDFPIFKEILTTILS